MSAYLLIVLAILTRVVPHPSWLNFTAVGASLLYFGAKRPVRQFIVPIALFAGVDYYLTVFFYNYPFHISEYLLTWSWYLGVLWLGHYALTFRASTLRVTASVLASSTSFFLLSNFAAWLGSPNLYPRSYAGLEMAYFAGLPFYRNDLISTGLIAALAFGLPVAARHFFLPQHSRIANL
jgi:hypothetical protein